LLLKKDVDEKLELVEEAKPDEEGDDTPP